ncbi:lysophospholipase L2 [Serratia microhaemolytica]|uniref:lysophospholipase L2 n=1 Tax=Serratia microhaemolytica TaxID=2675110 RepID=UPI000FDEACF9|nr:lysophospholipase L2 [Serratia microhaemolytica]
MNATQWFEREKYFAAFVTGSLLPFWQQRQEGEFSGVAGVPIRFVCFQAPHHRRVVVISPGRVESYVKYPEVAYDLFHHGYDVMIVDHRGQGRSGRLLDDPQRGHVVKFSDYVDDFESFYQKIVQPRAYQQHFALAHSMGAAILTLFLARHPTAFSAAALSAPMFGIDLPMPNWLAERILDWTEERVAIRDTYAVGTRQWLPLPYLINTLTHSRERYQQNLRYYIDHPEIQLGGPTYHWVRESIQAGKQIIAQAANITTPLLLLQASEDTVVDNQAQTDFCHTLVTVGGDCEGGKPWIINGAYHEILFEQDQIRTQALSVILRFFAQHFSDNR